MNHPAADFKHPYHADYEDGRNDACEFNPYFKPEHREEEAYDAYKAGYEFGTKCMDQYFKEQEQCSDS